MSGFRSILVPVDLAHSSSWQFALPRAVELARGAGGRVTVLHVVRDLASLFGGVRMAFQLDALIHEAEAALDRIVAECPAEGVALGRRAVAGSISSAILRAAEDLGCDLIVMASHRPEMRDYLIGPNAAHVALHAPISVLVLREFA